MCDDWDDLIEYVVQKFLRNFQTNGCYDVASPQRSVSGSQDQEGSRSMESEPQHSYDIQPEPRGSATAGDDDPFFEAPPSDVESLRGRLMDSGLFDFFFCLLFGHFIIIFKFLYIGFQKQLDWVQSSLLTVCSARLGTYSGQEFRNPIACLSLKMNVPCPVVPWTEVEASALRSDLFLFLLHRTGLLLPTPTVGIYPRIPREWTADALYSVALFFGPVEQQKVDFDLNRVTKVDIPIPDIAVDLPLNGQSFNHIRQSNIFYNDSFLAGSCPSAWQPYLGPGPSTSLSAVPHHWLHWVEQSGSLFRSAEITSHGHNSSHSMSNHSHRPLDRFVPKVVMTSLMTVD